MASSITTAFVEQFKANVVHLAQQSGSVFRGVFPEEPVVGKRVAVERLGSTTASLKTGRNVDTEYVDPAHTRRWLSTKTFYWSALVDRYDKIRMLINPESEYAQAAAMAMARQYDQVIIDAFDASVVTGEDATGTAATFDTTNNQIAVASPATNLNLTKILQAKKILDSFNVDPSIPRYFVVHPEQLEAMLGIEQLTSADYNSVRALVQGDMNTYAGFTWLMSTKLDVASNVRDCYAFAANAMRVGIGQDIVARVDELPQKHYSTQVYFSMDLGAIRVEETNIVKVLCDDTA